jgi:hypothetical protein
MKFTTHLTSDQFYENLNEFIVKSISIFKNIHGLLSNNYYYINLFNKKQVLKA